MAQRVVLFTEDEARIIDSHVMRGRDRPQYVLPVKKRRKLVGGGSSCTDKLAVWLLGVPTGGSITLPVTVNDVTENVVLNYNYDTDDIETAFETHSEIAADSVTAESAGGGFPYQVVRITIPGTWSVGNHTNSLTGGTSPYALVDRCCG